MEYWDKKHRRFKFIPTLTQEEKEGYLHGRIPAILGDQYSDLSRHSNSNNLLIYYDILTATTC